MHSTFQQEYYGKKVVCVLTYLVFIEMYIVERHPHSHLCE